MSRSQESNRASDFMVDFDDQEHRLHPFIQSRRDTMVV